MLTAGTCPECTVARLQNQHHTGIPHYVLMPNLQRSTRHPRGRVDLGPGDSARHASTRHLLPVSSTQLETGLCDLTAIPDGYEHGQGDGGAKQA